jgi:hypothetical protein
MSIISNLRVTRDFAPTFERVDVLWAKGNSTGVALSFQRQIRQCLPVTIPDISHAGLSEKPWGKIVPLATPCLKFVCRALRFVEDVLNACVVQSLMHWGKLSKAWCGTALQCPVRILSH